MTREELQDITAHWGTMTPEARNDARLELTAALEEAWQERDWLSVESNTLAISCSQYASQLKQAEAERDALKARVRKLKEAIRKHQQPRQISPEISTFCVDEELSAALRPEGEKE